MDERTPILTRITASIGPLLPSHRLDLARGPRTMGTEGEPLVQEWAELLIEGVVAARMIIKVGDAELAITTNLDGELRAMLRTPHGISQIEYRHREP
jgi:hypothetical protein